MGLERFLRGALKCYSSHHGQLNLEQTVRIFRVSMSTWTPPSLSSAAGRVGFLLGPCSRTLVHTGGRTLCSSTQPSRDVTLFLHDRTNFFRLLSVFCGGQFLFWTYLGHFAYTGLKDTRASAGAGGTKAAHTTGLAGMWSFDMNLGSNSWRFGFTAGCLAIGAGIVGLGVLFCRRSVGQVVLHRGGRMVTVSTQSPMGLGRGRRITVPLSQVACYAHRQESPSFIPLKVKGHRFYFLLDREGTVNNARLFDSTVGAYRQI